MSQPFHPAKAIARILMEARTQLNMTIAFVSEFSGGRRIFRFIDGDVRAVRLAVDQSDPLEEGYCQRVVDGRLPFLIHDAQQEPGAAGIAATRELGIGAHISVPIVFSDGRLYGTFCCFSQTADPSLDERHVALVRAMAELAASEIEREELSVEARRNATERVRRVLDDGFAMAYQPIVDLNTLDIVGVEALARFGSDPSCSPADLFDDGWTAGLGADLEIAAAKRATSCLSELPDDVFLAINVSPETVLSAGFESFLRSTEPERIVLELTEHSQIADYRPLRRALDAAREVGVRIAIDDVGTGHADLQHLLALAVDILKLDITITRGVQTDPVRHSLAGAIVSAGSAMGLTVIAEGIETREELESLRALGFDVGQGFFLGRPELRVPPSADPSVGE